MYATCSHAQAVVAFDNRPSRKRQVLVRRDRKLVIIGAVGGLVGLLVISFAPLDDLGPLEQWLVGVITACGTMCVGIRGTGLD